jgi:predicted membrane chloride channel (bestrophin family)
MEANTHLINCMRCCRELVQHTVAFTRHETGMSAKQWRTQVARRTIVLLQTTVAVLEYQSKGVDAWKTLELSRDEKKALLAAVGKSNERAPIVLTLFLRSSIAAHTQNLVKDFHVNKELYLLAFVSDFSKSYHGLMQLITTPFPFPLVQMARTFLFFWIFSLPFALVAQYQSIPALLVIIFILTYGFVGLEYVSIEMDDPFGDDPCDFDVHGLSRVVLEDIYIAIFDIDGKEAANALKGLVVGDDDDEQVKKRRQSHKRVPSSDIMRKSMKEGNAIGVGRLLRRISDGKNLGNSDGEDEHPKEPDHGKGGHYKLPPVTMGKKSKETTPLLDK